MRIGKKTPIKTTNFQFDTWVKQGSLYLAPPAEVNTGALSGAGAGVFNATSTYLAVSGTLTDFEIHADNTTEWTVDFFVRVFAVNDYIIQGYKTNDQNAWTFAVIDTTGFEYNTYVGNVLKIQLNVGSNPVYGRWYHVAMCKVDDEFGLYVDGVQVDYQQNTDTFSGITGLNVGANYVPAGYMHGNLSEVRVQRSNIFSAAPVSGLTDTIIVPTSKLDADSDTKLLLHFDTEQIVDSSDSAHTITNTSVTLAYTDTKLLAHGNGILDASVSNNKALTAVGTANAFGNKWGTYGGGFNGTSSYLTIPDSSDWDVFATTTEDWTIDFWIHSTKVSANQEIFSHYSSPGSLWYLQLISGSPNTLRWASYDSGYGVECDGGKVPLNKWVHVAAIKVADNYALYVDGVQTAYTGASLKTVNITGNLIIGQFGDSSNYYKGTLDEIRIEKTNVFSAAPNANLSDTITVPTGPHTATADTKLLLHLENNVTDSGPNVHTVTNNNMVYGQSHFGGGSLYLDGASSWVTTPYDSAAWEISANLTDDRTLDAWVKISNLTPYNMLFGCGTGGASRWLFHNEAGGGSMSYDLTAGAGISIHTAYGGIQDYSWHHMMLVKRGNVYAIYIDGAQQAYGTTTTATTVGSSVLRIGSEPLGNDFTGLIADARIVTGNILNANPMVRPYAHFSLNDSAASTTVDDKGSGNNDGTSSTNTVNLTGLAKCGYDGPLSNKSAKFDGSSSYISTPSDADWNLIGSSSDSWTIDLWVNFTNPTGPHSLVGQFEDVANDAWNFQYSSSANGLRFVAVSGGGVIIDVRTYEPITTGWHHVALVKKADEYGIYVDGIQKAYVKDSSTDTFSGQLCVGSGDGSQQFYLGYMDEVRIIQSNPFSATPTPIPYAHYKLNDDNANTTVRDDGTGANNGTASGNTSTLSAEGKILRAFDFTRTSSEYINIDALEADIDADTTGTFSVWVNPDDLTQSFPFAFGDTNLDYYLYVRLKATGYFEVSLQAGAGVWTFTTTTTQVSAGNWYHIVLIQDGTEPKFYVNNTLQTLSYSVSVDKTKWLAYIGANLDNGRIGCAAFSSVQYDYWDGKIDDFRYYQNVALTLAQVQSIYNSGNGTEDSMAGPDTITVPTSKHTSDGNTKLLLHLGDGDVTDSSGSPHTMTNTAVSFGSFDFNGTSEYVNVDALISDIGSDTTGSFSFWFNANNITTSNWLFSAGDTNAEMYLGMQLYDSKIYVTSNRGGGNSWTWYTTAPSTSTWMHIAIVQNGIAPVFYINGTLTTGTFYLETDKTVWFANSAGLDNFRLGCLNQNNAGNTAFFSGKIDDFRYYQNYTLTAAEIVKIYNSGEGVEHMGDTITVPTETLTGDDPIISHSFLVDGNANEEYRLVGRWSSGQNAGNIYLVFNGDTATNYGYQLMTGQDSSASTSRATGYSNAIIGQVNVTSYRGLSDVIIRAKSGTGRLILANYIKSVNGTLVTAITQMASVWNNSPSNIKTIDIKPTSSGTLAGGTSIELYKKVLR